MIHCAEMRVVLDGGNSFDIFVMLENRPFSISAHIQVNINIDYQYFFL